MSASDPKQSLIIQSHQRSAYIALTSAAQYCGVPSFRRNSALRHKCIAKHGDFFLVVSHKYGTQNILSIRNSALLFRLR
jgi:hypothetical protein